MISTHELARLCGVSQGTVDRVLHDRPGVSTATRNKILAAAAKHGYQPHPAARELLTGERRLVGAIVPAVNNVFFMDLMTAIGEKLMAKGFRFFLTPVRDPASFLDVMGDFAARRSRAIIAAPPSDGIEIPSAVTSESQIITVGGRTCLGQNVTYIAPDEVRAGALATQHLADLGHKRILHITYGYPSLTRRDHEAGFLAAVRDRGLEGRVVRADQGEQIETALREYAPTAAFCHSDYLALSVIRMLHGMGKRVPEDLSVIGVNCCPTFTALNPGLTSLAYPFDAVAACVESLVSGAGATVIPAMAVVEGRTVSPLAQ